MWKGVRENKQDLVTRNRMRKTKIRGENEKRRRVSRRNVTILLEVVSVRIRIMTPRPWEKKCRSV